MTPGELFVTIKSDEAVVDMIVKINTDFKSGVLSLEKTKSAIREFMELTEVVVEKGGLRWKLKIMQDHNI